MRTKAWIPVSSRARIGVAFLLFIGAVVGRDFMLFAATNPAAPSGSGPKITDAQRAFFEAKIRPVMESKCYSCHSASAKEVEGGLLLDTRAAVQKGGVDGAVVVPGNPDASMLIKAIRYTNKDLAMPPEDGGGKLSDATIHDFETWVKMGAPDPRDGAVPTVVAKPYDTSEAKKWWAFQPMKRPAPASVASDWARGEIDKYILAGLQEKNLKPVEDADKLTLIRRAYFDLIGLQPTPAEVDAFLADDSPKAVEKVVDDLLARPEFGEHWGRHWLDVARYAESAGKDFNATFPEAWRYRDYVIASFNADKPYNQFVREQLAGDLLPAQDVKKRADQLIATGFLAIGVKELSEQSTRQFDLDLADEQVDATSQAFLGLTVSCARCHDHKFDPILQRDYYSMAGIFLSTKTDYGTIAGPRNNEDSTLIELPANANLPNALSPLTAAQRAQIVQDLATATADYNTLLASRPLPAGRRGALALQQQAQQQQAANAANVVQLALQIRNALAKKSYLEAELAMYDDSGKPKAFCMGVQDRPTGFGTPAPMPPVKVGPAGNPVKNQPSGFETIADSPLFFRGEMSDPRDRVPRGFPAFLQWTRAPQISQSESGRKELADWIVAPANPLTSRVMANRIWYWLFGQGIVGTVDNFGTMGDSPSNQPLLDYLAYQLMDNKWSVKKTIRQVMLSHAYQEASTYDADDYGADPQDALLWRHSQLRLNAECIRDAMLAASGQLILKQPVGSAVAVAGNGAVGAGLPFERLNEEKFVGATGFNRSVYLPVPRDVIPDSLAVFDYPDSTVVNGARETTNVPSQALYLLNSDFVVGQSRLLAQRVLTTIPAGSAGGPVALRQQRVDLAFRLVLCRHATAAEQAAAGKFLDKMLTDPNVKLMGVWQDFCLSLYNTAEFRYLN
jgi:hypothetical protein